MLLAGCLILWKGGVLGLDKKSVLGWHTVLGLGTSCSSSSMLPVQGARCTWCGLMYVQIRGVIYCLEHLGPWCAAAAAYLDLLAPPSAAEEEAAAAEQAALEASGNVWTGEEEDSKEWLCHGAVLAWPLVVRLACCVTSD